MRKRVRILLLAAIVAAVVVPVGFALSLESSVRANSAVHGVVPIADGAQTRFPIIATTTAAVMAMPDVPEGAKLLGIGAILIGLAAAMRRRS